MPCPILSESLEANVQCAKMVYRETRIQKGDGFQAWKGTHLTRCRNVTGDGSCT